MLAAPGHDPNALRRQLRGALAARSEVRFGLLFGSHARGTSGPRSDVDVAVLAPGVDLPRLAAALSQACGEEIDVIALDREVSIPMLDELLRDGELLYEAVLGSYAIWRSHALFTLELDLPWYARTRRLAPPRGAKRPLMVNRNVLSAKLAELADRVARIRECRRGRVEELKDDRDAVELVSFNFMLAVQVCVDIASHLIADGGWPLARTIGEGFTRLEERGVISAAIGTSMRDAVGLRNIVARGYAGVDLALVHRASFEGVDDLDSFARSLATWAARQTA
jgi:uncharacterized protein YutE (UPF0331/DUF86 family)/predicted nucleotidyltransferase